MKRSTAALLVALLFIAALLLWPQSQPVAGSSEDVGYKICKRGIQQAHRALVNDQPDKARKILENTAYAAGFDIEGD